MHSGLILERPEALEPTRGHPLEQFTISAGISDRVLVQESLICAGAKTRTCSLEIILREGLLHSTCPYCSYYRTIDVVRHDVLSSERTHVDEEHILAVQAS